jgi:hypothetical protein
VIILVPKSGGLGKISFVDFCGEVTWPGLGELLPLGLFTSAALKAELLLPS